MADTAEHPECGVATPSEASAGTDAAELKGVSDMFLASRAMEILREWMSEPEIAEMLEQAGPSAPASASGGPAE